MPTGCRIKEHLDKINVGDSMLVSFGDYTGGTTYVKNKNDRNYEIHDCRLQPICFNGAERLHGVHTISNGERFSLVFYKNKFFSHSFYKYYFCPTIKYLVNRHIVL